MMHQNALRKHRRTQMRRPRARWAWPLGLIVIVGLVSCARAWGQPPEPAPGMSISRSWYMEAAIVAGMCGLALFVVCRSSRRN